MKCPTCGFENTEGVASCASCGASLAAPGAMPPGPDAAPAPTKTERQPLSAKYLALIGALLNVAGAYVFLTPSAGWIHSDIRWIQLGIICIKWVIIGVTGYLLGFRIAAKPSNGPLLGLLGGVIIGAVKDLYCPHIDQVMGSVLGGAILGLVYGSEMVSIVRYYRRPENWLRQNSFTVLLRLTASPEPDVTPAPMETECQPLSAKSLALKGALFTMAGNGIFFLLWLATGNTDLTFKSFWTTSVIVGATGYFLGLRIAAKPSYLNGLRLGLLGGAITGLVNGTAIFPTVGDAGTIGAVIGAILGIICGPAMIYIERGFRL